MNNLKSKTTTFMKTKYDDVMNNPNSKSTTLMKTNMTMNVIMSWTTSNPRQRPLWKPICRNPQLKDNDLYEIQYDDVMNNRNFKTTTFMKTNMTMSWTTSNPRQLPLWKPIWRCHEQPQIQDNDLYENQYDQWCWPTLTVTDKSSG